MGRKQQDTLTATTDQNLSVKVPSFFRCPISLDVMKSPVSLCTGVTYDRASIQSWLDSGHNTCPATMQPLPSTDLIPNLTVHRLITLWAHSSAAATTRPLSLSDANDPLTSLHNLVRFFSNNNNNDDFEKNHLINAPSFLETLNSSLSNENLEISEAAASVFSKILISDGVDQDNKNASIRSAAVSLPSLIRVLKEGTNLESRSNAAAVIAAVITIAEYKDSIAHNTDLIRELIKLLTINGEEANAVAIYNNPLSSLLQLSTVRRVRALFVELGIVKTLTRIMSSEKLPVAVAEKAMRLLEAVSACRDGREAICENAETTIAAIMRRMMRIGREGTEAAVVVLWSVCHLFRDRRAQEAVEANGGLTKMLVVMQSDCSPAVRRMAGDLMKIFKVNAKCSLAGYDTKTKHIMPF